MNMHDSHASIRGGRVDRLDRPRQHVFPAWSAWLPSVSRKWSADCRDECPSSKCRLGYYTSYLQRFQPPKIVTQNHHSKPSPETITSNHHPKPLPKTITWNHHSKRYSLPINCHCVTAIRAATIITRIVTLYSRSQAMKYKLCEIIE